MVELLLLLLLLLKNEKRQITGKNRKKNNSLDSSSDKLERLNTIKLGQAKNLKGETSSVSKKKLFHKD